MWLSSIIQVYIQETSFTTLSQISSISDSITLGRCLPSDDFRFMFTYDRSKHFLLHHVHLVFGAHPASYPLTTRDPSTEVNQPANEAGHLPLSSAGLRMHGDTLSLPHMWRSARANVQLVSVLSQPIIYPSLYSLVFSFLKVVNRQIHMEHDTSGPHRTLCTGSYCS